MARSKSKKMEMHSFWCLNCGKKVMELPRNHGFQHENFHRKKLYCPWCKEEINCIECKNEEQEYNFKIDFESGVYNDEAENSLLTCRTPSVW